MGFLSRKNDHEAKASKTLTIVNRLGMHARPSAMFVKAASRFRSEVWVEKDGERVNGKSIMGLMMLAAGQGSKLLVTCEGADAEKALNEIESIIARKFDED
jgi:phosphocarrier protein